MDQPRATQRFKPKKPASDGPLIKAMREVAMRLPRAGYRTVTKHLRRDRWQVNEKRVWRAPVLFLLLIWSYFGVVAPSKTIAKSRLLWLRFPGPLQEDVTLLRKRVEGWALA